MKFPAIWIGIIILMIVSSGCIALDEPIGTTPNLNGETPTPITTERHSTSEDSTEPHTFQQTEDTMSQRPISAEIEPLPNQSNQAALALQRLGFRILHIGPTISVEGPRSLWETTFNVTFEEVQKTVMPEIDQQVTYLRAITDDLVIPENLASVVSDVMFVEPPDFYQGVP